MIRAILLSLALLGPNMLAAQQGDDVMDFALDDPAMMQARADARASLPLFLANAIDERGISLAQVAIKVAFPVASSTAENEVIWVAPFAWDGAEGFAGFLANAPNFMGDLQQGDRVEFTRDMVRDWSFTGSTGLLYGNFSTRVMVTGMSQDEAAYFASLLSENPVPEGWK